MKTREQLIADCQGLVRSLAWQIHCKLPAHVDLEDLVAYGQIGLLEAAQAYDPTRENQFSTYSYYRIRGAIFDGLSKMSWFNRASFNSGEYEYQRQLAKEKKAAALRKTPDDLIADCQGLVRTLAWQILCKLPPARIEMPALIALGQLGLETAARRFDATRHGQFSTFCYSFIQDAIFDGLSRTGWFSRADYHAGLYEQEARRQPPPPPVVDAPRPVTDAEPHPAQGLISIICHGFADGDADQARADEAGQPTPIDVAMQQEMLQKLRELIDALPEQQQVLIRATYFEGLTLKDAGERLGMSKAWASRLHAKTIDQLAHSFRASRMAD